MSDADVAECVSNYFTTPKSGDKQSPTLFFLGVGPHVGLILKECEPVDALLIAEPNKERFFGELSRTDFTYIKRACPSGNIVFIVGGAPAPVVIASAHKFASMSILRSLDTVSIPSVVSDTATINSPYWETPRRLCDCYEEIFSAVMQIKTQVDAAATVDFNQSYLLIENQLANLERLAVLPGIESLRGVAAGRPAVLCGAGASLWENAGRLAEARAKGAVILTTTSGCCRVVAQR